MSEFLNPKAWAEALAMFGWGKLFFASALLAVSFAFGLYASDSTLATFGLLEARNAYRMWVGVACLGFGLLALFSLLISLHRRYAISAECNRVYSALLLRLHDLTPDEQAMLSRFIENNERCLRLEADEVVSSLLHAGILFVPPQGVNVRVRDWNATIYQISDDAFAHLRASPQLLYTELEKEWFAKRRELEEHANASAEERSKIETELFEAEIKVEHEREQRRLERARKEAQRRYS